MAFLAASSAQSSKNVVVVVIVGMDFQSQNLSEKKGKVASDRRQDARMTMSRIDSIRISNINFHCSAVC